MGDEQIPEELKKELNNYKIPADLKEVVNRIAKDAEDMDLRLSEYKFVHSSRMFGIAIGGAVFVLGIIFVLVSIYTFFNLFNLSLTQQTRLIIGSASIVIGAIQLLAGVLLIGQ